MAQLPCSPARAAGETAREAARRGIELAKRMDFENAAKAFEKAAELAQTPEERAAIEYDLGTLRAKTGQRDGAEESLARALAHEGLPSRRDAFFNMGVNRFQKAADPKSDSAKDPQKTMAVMRGALDSFRESLIADPADREAKHNFEVARDAIKKLEEQMRKQQQEEQQGGDNKDEQEQKDQEKSEQDQQGKSGKDGEQSDEQKKEQERNEQNQQQNEKQNEKNQQQKPEGPADEKKEGEEQENPSDQAQSPIDRSATPTPTPGGQKPGDQNKQEGGLESTPTPAPTPGAPRDPAEASPGADGGTPQPLTPEQLDAMRVLNALEKDKPEQYKRLFRFKGKGQARRVERDW